MPILGMKRFECCNAIFCNCIAKDDPVMPISVGRVYKHRETSQLVTVSALRKIADTMTLVYSQPIPRDPCQVGRDVLALSDFRELYDEVPVPEVGSNWMHHQGTPYEVIAFSNGCTIGRDWLPALVTYKAYGSKDTYSRPWSEFYHKFKLTAPAHSLECLYGYEVSSLNIQDTDATRLLFWAVHERLEYNDQDRPIVPYWGISTSHERCRACLSAPKQEINDQTL